MKNIKIIVILLIFYFFIIRSKKENFSENISDSKVTPDCSCIKNDGDYIYGQNCEKHNEEYNWCYTVDNKCGMSGEKNWKECGLGPNLLKRLDLIKAKNRQNKGNINWEELKKTIGEKNVNEIKKTLKEDKGSFLFKNIVKKINRRDKKENYNFFNNHIKNHKKSLKLWIKSKIINDNIREDKEIELDRRQNYIVNVVKKGEKLEDKMLYILHKTGNKSNEIKRLLSEFIITNTLIDLSEENKMLSERIKALESLQIISNYGSS